MNFTRSEFRAIASGLLFCVLGGIFITTGDHQTGFLYQALVALEWR